MYDTGQLKFISDVQLLLIDEVHTISEDRGPALEAGVVSRLSLMATLPQMQGCNLSKLRCIAVSATIPNVTDIARWLKVPESGCKQYGEEVRCAVNAGSVAR